MINILKCWGGNKTSSHPSEHTMTPAEVVALKGYYWACVVWALFYLLIQGIPNIFWFCFSNISFYFTFVFKSLLIFYLFVVWIIWAFFNFPIEVIPISFCFIFSTISLYYTFIFSLCCFPLS